MIAIFPELKICSHIGHIPSCLVYALAILVVISGQSFSQTKQVLDHDKTPAVTDTQGLTADLLDLLVKPPPEKVQRQKDSRQVSPKPDQPSSGSEGAGMHPLVDVQQQMITVSSLLEKGKTDDATRELQTDIVKRLDDLIDQLSKPSRNPAEPPNSETRQQQRKQQSETQRKKVGSSPSQSSGKKRQNSDGQSKMNPDSLPQPSGPDGGDLRNPVVGETQVQLADPRAMQMKVWGQLPQRVRQQMQSRMVEQFLPSYREQIEAYYRELAK